MPIDPLTMMLIAGGGQLLSGIGQAVAGSRENEQKRRRAARLEDIANMIQGGGEYGTLRNALSRQLSGQLDATQAMLSARGLADSGAGAGLAANAMAMAQGQYANAVSQDQMRRMQMVSDIFGSGAYQDATNQVSPASYLLGGLGQGLTSGATILGGMDADTLNAFGSSWGFGGGGGGGWSPNPNFSPTFSVDPMNRRGIFE